MVAAGVIQDYAIGGAIGAMFYVEPFTTQDVDIFFVYSTEPGLLILAPIYDYLRSHGYEVRGEMIVIESWDVQFLYVPNALYDEGLGNANVFEVGAETVRVFSPEYLAAIMLQTGRPKDFARVRMFFDEKVIDNNFLSELISRYALEEQWRKYQQL